MTSGRTTAVADDLRRRIQAGEYQPGDKLPTVAELLTEYADRYQVGSRSTIQAALNRLTAEGLLTTRRGRNVGGIYVRRHQVIPRYLIKGIWIEYDRAIKGDTSGGIFEATTGAEDVTVDTMYALDLPPAKVAADLQIDPGTPVLVRTFNYSVGGQPHHRGRSYMTAELAARAGLRSPADEEVGGSTILQLHRVGITVEGAFLVLETRPPTAEETAALEIPTGTSVYERTKTLHFEGRPVETSVTVEPGDRVAYKFDINFKEGRP